RMALLSCGLDVVSLTWDDVQRALDGGGGQAADLLGDPRGTRHNVLSVSGLLGVARALDSGPFQWLLGMLSGDLPRDHMRRLTNALLFATVTRGIAPAGWSEVLDDAPAAAREVFEAGAGDLFALAQPEELPVRVLIRVPGERAAALAAGIRGGAPLPDRGA